MVHEIKMVSCLWLGNKNLRSKNMPSFQQYILEELDEATYPGNIGFEEMVQFWKNAEKGDLKKMDKLLSKPKPDFNDFKELIRDVVGTELK